MASGKSNVLKIKDHVSAEEWKLRVELAAAYRVAAHEGWGDLIFTHFSARVPGEETHFLLNPFGLLFEEITASNLVKVDLNGSPVVETEYPVNPAGFIIHGAIHEAGADAHCVLHTHTSAGIAVAAQKDGLLPISQTALTIRSDLAYHDYEGIVLDASERERLLANMGNKHNLILKNHGLLCVGETVGAAFLRLHSLQRACEAQIMAQSGGAELIHLSEEICQRVEGQTIGMEVSAHFTGEALVRKAESLDPGFRG